MSTNRFQEYNVYDGLTSVKTRMISNVAFTGIYDNGPLNNGVGATITYSTSSLIIDGVDVFEGDSVLFALNFISGFSHVNGIYIRISPNNANAVLQRRADFQSIEQIRAGQFVTIEEGSDDAGAIFTVRAPLPARFGIDQILIAGSIPQVTSRSNFDPTAQLDVFGVILSEEVTPTGGTLSAITGSLVLQNGENGLSGGFGVVGQVVNNNGNITGGGEIAGLMGRVVFTGTSQVNGHDVFGVKGQFVGTAGGLNSTQMSGLCFANNTTTTRIGSMLRFDGDADYYEYLNGSTITYFKTAGSAAGSAGDTTKCNAVKVLAIRVAGVDYFIPLFNQNT